MLMDVTSDGMVIVRGFCGIEDLDTIDCFLKNIVRGLVLC